MTIGKVGTDGTSENFGADGKFGMVDIVNLAEKIFTDGIIGTKKGEIVHMTHWLTKVSSLLQNSVAIIAMHFN